MKFRGVFRRFVLLVVVFAVHVPHPQAQTSSALPQARVGATYTSELKVEGGKPPLKWSLSQGALPPGLELSDSGTIHGTPSAATQSPMTFTVKVSDSSSPSQETVIQLSLGVAAAPKQKGLKIILPAGSQTKAGKSTDGDGSLNPATFIKIYEDPKSGSRQIIYDPSKKGLARHLQGTADEGSTIVILPDAKLMGGDVPLNKLYITAKMASGDTSKDVPVIGYSEIGKDKATMASQTAASFESASNIKDKILDMSFDSIDILTQGYAKCLPPIKASMTLEEWKQSEQHLDLNSACVHDIDAKIAAAVRNTDPNAHPFQDTELQPFIERLNFYQSEIQKISSFFSDPQNINIVEKIGAQIFWIDRDTLEGIAQQYQNDAQALSDSTNSEQKKAKALQNLVERTKLIYQDFGDLRQEIISKVSEQADNQNHSKEEWVARYNKATEDVGKSLQESVFEGLKRLLAPGAISLVENKAKDGDRLTITVETVPANGSSGGISAVFEITVKKYGMKVGLGSSLLFIRRLGVTDAEANPPTGSTTAPVNRINFAPSPGVTFGMAFFKRGNTGWDKFFRGLSPGAGINVSFMNFNDPSFDLATGKFVNTNGTNVQVGSGIIGSIFDNKLQLSYGWNLNVEKRRNYFGVGFDFIKAGEDIAKFFK